MKRSQTLILCYHRVAEGVEDPFLLCVRPENFAAHLEELTRWWEPSSLDDLSVPSDRPRVVVTFDDGYCDNLVGALPIAEAKGVPLAVFVTSGIFGQHRGFWWDRLAALLRSRPSDISEICLPIGAETIRVELGASRFAAELQEVRSHLIPLPVHEIECALDIVAEQWSVASAVPPDARCLSASELRELAAIESVTIGAHTVDHVRLRGRPQQEQQDTIASSKNELEQMLGHSVSHFAYPFGRREDFDDHSVNAVRSAGFDTACTTLPGTAGPLTDRYRLPRRMVMDWGRFRFRAQMMRWSLGRSS